MGTHSLRQESNALGAGTRVYHYPIYHERLEVYLSHWMYIPVEYTINVNGGAWFNCMQFQSRKAGGSVDPIHILGLRTQTGQLRFDLNWFNQLKISGPKATDGVGGKSWVSGIEVPVGRWFNVEIRHKYSEDFDGVVQVWQDGQKIFDQVDVRTGYPLEDFGQPGVANRMVASTCYCELVTPKPVVIYRDTFKLSDERVNDAETTPPGVEEPGPTPPENVTGTFWSASKNEDGSYNIHLVK
jgi:hypothetical protein